MGGVVPAGKASAPIAAASRTAGILLKSMTQEAALKSLTWVSCIQELHTKGNCKEQVIRQTEAQE